MTHSLPHFYAGLHRVEAVKSVNGGEAMRDLLQAMKDFVLGAMLVVAVLALFMGVRFALFVPLHNEMISVKDPAPIVATDGGCAVRRVKMPCFWQPNPEVGAAAPVPRQNGSARAEAIVSQDMRCPVRQVKFPCLQYSDPRS
jgi:hypothetical protein